jgi:hypothetical protein
MQDRSRAWLPTRFLATAAMVMMYFAGALVPSNILTSTTAEAARGRGGGRGGRGHRGGGHRGRGRGRGFRFRGRGRSLYSYPDYYSGVDSCSYVSSECASRWGWGTRAWYSCMWRQGCSE